ncbi:MAG TPA: tRNA (adenosine(37)-N6)-dimethylallyltransferase MiaA [Gammaproteobacteria bacterium]|nr:tRNA (adenosine(37)-N6)-dimethylallyltransferase MiaA [Gammaproteobacteria bacterium]
MTHLPPAILLMGPTASGKTALAVELVRRFPCDIISVDSAMIYRGMDIGTAKPDADTLRAAPHRLIDIRDPLENYSAGEFRRDALRQMREIAEAGRIPLLVGGTMLYFHVLQRGIAELPQAHAVQRADLDARAAREGWAALHAELARVDPAAAARIHPNDPQRIQRALEVHAVTGKPLSELQRGSVVEAVPFRLIKLALAPAERGTLHARIAMRFRAMMAAGFLEEVRSLAARAGLTAQHPSMRSVGYRQLWEFLDQGGSLDAAVERGIAATRQFAKRQLTRLRAEPDVTWYDSDAPALARQVGGALEPALETRAFRAL